MVSSIRSYLAEEIGPLDTCLWVRKADCDAEIARLTAERDIWKSENDRILLIRAQRDARIAELEEAILVRDSAIKVANDSVERVDQILASWHKVFPVDDPVIARRMVEDMAHAERDAAIARAERAERVAYRFTSVRQKIMEWHDLIESEQDLDDSAGDGISVRDVVLKEMEEAAENPSALVEACEGGRDEGEELAAQAGEEGEVMDKRLPEYRCEIDWDQARLNRGSYCFHRYTGATSPCGRAEYWAGHHVGPDDVRHNFVSLSDVFWTFDQLANYGKRKGAEIARLTAERDEAKALAVWAVRRGAGFCSYDQRVYWAERARQFVVSNHAQTDGTDDSLYRALVEAMKGGES